MSLDDIRNKPIEIDFEGEKLKLEYDNTALAYLEQLSGKGLFKIRDSILAKNLFFQDSIAVFKAALLKHHTEETIDRVEKKLIENIYLISRYNAPVVHSYMKMMYAPEVYIKIIGEQKEDQGEEETSPKKH